jgi:N-acyl-D-amino-acid deacylase
MSAKRCHWIVIVAIVAVAAALAAWPMTRQSDVQQTAPAPVHRPAIASDRAGDDDRSSSLPDTLEVDSPRNVTEQRDAQAALQLGLPLIQQAAANYPKHRKCFSCHHQTLPMLVMVAARESGLEVDQQLLEAQADFTHKSFHNQVESMRQGEGVGGHALTVGYGLWALRLAGRPADETTEAMVAYLLKTQHEDGHWEAQTIRPPLEESFTTCTVLAVMGMRRYAAASQAAEVDSSINKAKAWLSTANPQSQEDLAMALWGSAQFGATPDELRASRDAAVAKQRDNGGWAQLAEMESDAYATGQILFALQAAGMSSAELAYQRGVEYLLKTQQADGSWLVISRSKPIQTYFDNGDPHGKHQFISTPATCWALVVLANSGPERQTPVSR